MDKYLQIIANTLVLYSSTVKDVGILNGKMGILFFLYHYARFSGKQMYNDVADDLFDDILAHINSSTDDDFDNGYVGIGWLTNYLLENNFVEGNPNEVLYEIDVKIFADTGINPQQNICGKALYLLTRLKHNSNVVNNEYLVKLSDSCCKLFETNTRPIHLCFLTSLLYFFININIDKNKHTALLKQITDLLDVSLKRHLFDNVDRIAFHEMLNVFDVIEIKKTLNLADKTHESLQILPHIESFIKKTWLNIVYFHGKKEPLPSLNGIICFVDEKLSGLTCSDLSFHKGLAGLGFAIIRNIW
jgi:hypothetical protein